VLGINLAIAICAVIAFGIEEPPAPILAWFAVMVASLGFRLKVWRDFRRSPRHQGDEPRWTRRFTLAAGLNGGAWGLAPLLFYDPGSVVAQTFLPFVLAGMSGGSLVGLSGSKPAFFAFYLSLAAPWPPRLSSTWSASAGSANRSTAICVSRCALPARTSISWPPCGSGRKSFRKNRHSSR
jgi:hypothetical protein